MLLLRQSEIIRRTLQPQPQCFVVCLPQIQSVIAKVLPCSSQVAQRILLGCNKLTTNSTNGSISCPANHITASRALMDQSLSCLGICGEALVVDGRVQACF